LYVVAALAQEIEREVFLPDSFVGPEYPRTVCCLNWQSTTKAYVGGHGAIPAIVSFDPLTRTRNSRRLMPENVELLLVQPDGPLVFAFGRHRLMVVDGVQDSLVADVEYGDGPGLAVLDPARQALYLADRLYGSLAKYDYSGNRLDTIGVRLTPTVLCPARAAGRLYVAGRQDTIAVVDLTADSVVRYVGVGDEPSALAYDAARDRLYCANRLGNSVSVIDCGRDSVISTVAVGAGPVALALHSARNRLYCADRTAGRIAVVDLASLSLVDLVPVSQPVNLVCDTVHDRLYCGTTGTELVVIDCRVDTVCARLKVGEENSALTLAGAAVLCAGYAAGTVNVVQGDSVTGTVAAATAGPRTALVCQDKLYVAEERLNHVTVLSLPGFEPVARVRVGAKPRALCRGPNSARVYVACFGDSTVWVIDARADTVAGWLVSGNAPYHMVLDSAGSKLYCANFGSADIAVIDCRTDTLRCRREFGRACRRLAYNPTNRKVYGACHDSRTIAILDCVTDSVTARVATSAPPWTVIYDGADNLVYSGTSWGGPVIDGATDSVVGEISEAFYVKGMCWDPIEGRVYMANNYSSAVLCIDAPSHAVIRQLAVAALPADLTWSSRSGRAYLCHNRAGRITNQVSVIERDSVAAELWVRPSPVEAVADPERERVYVLNWESSCVTVLSDGVSGARENAGPAASGFGCPTIVGDALVLREMPCSALLLDISGREMTRLVPGLNDVRRLAPGVYFIQEAESRGHGFQGWSRKIVVRQ
jgi:YVTN family beta-propeller protein